MAWEVLVKSSNICQCCPPVPQECKICCVVYDLSCTALHVVSFLFLLSWCFILTFGWERLVCGLYIWHLCSVYWNSISWGYTFYTHSLIRFIISILHSKKQQRGYLRERPLTLILQTDWLFYQCFGEKKVTVLWPDTAIYHVLGSVSGRDGVRMQCN